MDGSELISNHYVNIFKLVDGYCHYLCLFIDYRTIDNFGGKAFLIVLFPTVAIIFVDDAKSANVTAECMP